MTGPERTSLPAGELLANERALIDYVRRGEELKLTAGQPGDKSRTVRAWVIRDILRGRLADCPDPHGLRLRGACIRERLDLENLTSTVPLALTDCLLPNGVIVLDAHLSFVTLTGCRLEHPDEPPLNADRLTANRLVLDHITVTGATTTLAAVTVRNAHLGELLCPGTRITNTVGSALDASGADVDKDVLLNEEFTASVTKGTSDPLLPSSCAVRLVSAHIGGRLSCNSATLTNQNGPALMADGMQVDQHIFFDEGFRATGNSRDGAVRLVSAHIGGALVCSSARLTNEDGPALNACVMQVDQNVFLDDSFRATGANKVSGTELVGAVELAGARIDGALFCSGATLTNEDGTALEASDLKVGLNVRLNDGFRATGGRGQGVVRLVGARIGGDLDCSGATLSGDDGSVFHGHGMRVDQSLYLVGRFVTKNAGADATIDIEQARVGGVLTFTPAPPAFGEVPLRIALDGLTYTGLPAGVEAGEWLKLLRTATLSYAAQPYQQLAAAHRAAGHDREVRRVLIAQRRDQLRGGTLTSSTERAWARIVGVTLAYGYEPWRALIFLVAVILAAVAFATTLGAAGGLAVTTTNTNTNSAAHPPPPVPCTVIDRVGVGLTLGAPLITTTASTHCGTTNTAPGQALVIIGWVLQTLAWAFATLFVAGFTSVVRKT